MDSPELLTEIGLGDTPARLEETYLEGQAKGEAKAILRFLEARGISVPKEARDRIAGCTDPGLLIRWLDRTPHAESVDDLFAEDAGTTADRAEA
ncbi:hypothetical protein [Streptomyces sp. NPDC001153]